MDADDSLIGYDPEESNCANCGFCNRCIPKEELDKLWEAIENSSNRRRKHNISER